jgi:hypothetical protein
MEAGSVSDWRSILNADPTEWLLERENLSVRYFTLTEILDKPENNILVKKTKEDIMKTGIVPAILAKQHKEGNWEEPERFYRAKYKGTVWQLLVLAELKADGGDERIKKACEFIIETSQDHESGGFSYGSSSVGGGRHSEVVPCLTGNMIWALIRLGFLEDPRIRRGIDWITTYQRFDDGVRKAPKGWPYDRFEMCFGRHTCHMGAVKALKALAEIPASKRSKEVNETIKNGVEYMLIHHIHKRSHHLNRVSKPGWLKFGFPLMYQTDALEILGILTKLGINDNRMQEAIDLLVSKQDRQGRWKLENTYNGRFQVSIERKGKQSKWITFKALETLKRSCG